MNQKNAAQVNFPMHLILLKIETCADNINQKVTVSGSVTSWFVLNACIMIDNVNGFMLPKIEP
jgi:hypothetical protein